MQLCLFVCLCHSKCVSCVLLDRQAGTVGVFEKCVLSGTYHRGARGKQNNERSNCLDNNHFTELTKTL